MDDFIFLELPEFKIAIFYFYSKIFEKTKDAHEAAIEIIKSMYKG
jgi:hypothetical protein